MMYSTLCGQICSFHTKDVLKPNDHSGNFVELSHSQQYVQNGLEDNPHQKAIDQSNGDGILGLIEGVFIFNSDVVLLIAVFNNDKYKGCLSLVKVPYDKVNVALNQHHHKDFSKRSRVDMSEYF